MEYIIPTLWLASELFGSLWLPRPRYARTTDSKYAVPQSKIASPKFELRSNFAYLQYVK